MYQNTEKASAQKCNANSHTYRQIKFIIEGFPVLGGQKWLKHTSQ